MGITDILSIYQEALIKGLLVTLKLSLIIWSSGLVLGALLGIGGAAYSSILGRFVEFLAYLVRAIPVLVLLFWAHYPFQYLIGFTIDPFITAAATISFVNIVLVGDMVRGVLLQFPSSYVEAAKVCGMSAKDTFLHVKAPIVSRQLTPALLSQQIQMLQVTIFGSLIAVEELFKVAQRINSIEYRPVEVYTGMALFFVAICLPVYLLSSRLERKFNRLFGNA